MRSGFAGSDMQLSSLRSLCTKETRWGSRIDFASQVWTAPIGRFCAGSVTRFQRVFHSFTLRSARSAGGLGRRGLTRSDRGNESRRSLRRATFRRCAPRLRARAYSRESPANHFVAPAFRRCMTKKSAPATSASSHNRYAGGARSRCAQSRESTFYSCFLSCAPGASRQSD